MATKRHMDIKRNITGHALIISDIAGYFLKKGFLLDRVILHSSCNIYFREPAPNEMRACPSGNDQSTPSLRLIIDLEAERGVEFAYSP